MDLRDLLLYLSDNVFERTSRRLVGLTDAELLWEPAPHCWSVRERLDGTVRADWAPYIGDGETTDSGFRRKTSTGGSAAPPGPAHESGMANLAPHRRVRQRQSHARAPGSQCRRGQTSPRHTSAAALGDLELAHSHWRAVLTAVTNEQLDEPITGARDPRRTKVGYVMYMIDEFTHHGAEVGVLRDLYAHVHRPDPLVADPPNLAELAWAGLWHLMPPLRDRGVNPDAESRGVRALHLAAAAGERDIVERLLRRGADSIRMSGGHSVVRSPLAAARRDGGAPRRAGARRVAMERTPARLLVSQNVHTISPPVVALRCIARMCRTGRRR